MPEGKLFLLCADAIHAECLVNGEKKRLYDNSDVRVGDEIVTISHPMLSYYSWLEGRPHEDRYRGFGPGDSHRQPGVRWFVVQRLEQLAREGNQFSPTYDLNQYEKSKVVFAGPKIACADFIHQNVAGIRRDEIVGAYWPDTGITPVRVSDYGVAFGMSGEVSAGRFGCAFSGEYGTSIADEYGLAVSGPKGYSIVGDHGRAVVGKDGVAMAGRGGMVGGDTGAILKIATVDGYAETVVGGDVSINMFYKLNSCGEFVPSGVPCSCPAFILGER